MISFIQGKIVEKGMDTVVVQSGGIGWEVLVSKKTSRALSMQKARVKLYTFLRFKQEGVFELYGFGTQAEKELFELLISVDKIGPKTALNILSAGSPDKIQSAIKLGKVDFLTRVVGLTDRTAERLIVELSRKIKTSAKHSETFDIDIDVQEALLSLGFTKGQIRKAVDKLDPDTTDFQSRVKQALKVLTGR
ncbi:MAG: Holliday junction branch migration protein RuvA [Candidatus Brennerbacteria bacterium CG23_combo_of_CG06-09_8_20_14_all_44_41]|nr:MAG: Holliday junction branch migration protein RuvA [Candidatus Brennerbacteria bacterium CG23_combo_of_CG06-09_8_20_14_all_44_41]